MIVSKGCEEMQISSIVENIIATIIVSVGYRGVRWLIRFFRESPPPKIEHFTPAKELRKLFYPHLALLLLSTTLFFIADGVMVEQARYAVKGLIGFFFSISASTVCVAFEASLVQTTNNRDRHIEVAQNKPDNDSR